MLLHNGGSQLNFDAVQNLPPCSGPYVEISSLNPAEPNILETKTKLWLKPQTAIA